jgi:hypothetical protein
LRELKFFSQWYLLPGRVFQDPAQKVAQPRDHAHCIIIPSLAYQPSHGVQRVKQKVRLDLPPKGI